MVFQELKDYMNRALLLSKLLHREIQYLYLSVSSTVIRFVLILKLEMVELMIFYVSRALQNNEIWYLSLEQLALALNTLARELQPYFQVHMIIILTNQPLRQVFQNPETS